jgi:hypothetical protein
MSLDLIFSQPVAQNPPTGIHSEKIGPSAGDRSAGTQTFSGSAEDGRDNFLSSLKQATQSQTPARQREHAAESRPAQLPGAVAGGTIEDACDHEVPPVAASLQNELDELPEPPAIDCNLTAFIRLLESLGFKNATETTDLQSLADANPADNDLNAAIESLAARFQQHPFGPAADLKLDLEKLQQLIAAALRNGDGLTVQGLSPGMLKALSQINQWLDGRTPGIPGQNAMSDWPIGPDPGGAGVSSAIAAEAEGSAETALKSPVANGNPSGLAPMPSAEHSVPPIPSENRGDAEPKLSTDSQPPGVKHEHDSKATPRFESADADSAKTKEAPGVGLEPRPANAAEISDRKTKTADPDHRGRMGPQDQPTVKPGASSGPDPVVVKMSDSQIQSVSDPAPPSRTFQETQLVRDGVVKAASTATEDAVGKVIKTEAAAPDNGLLNSSGQDLQKAAEPAAVQKESQPDQAVLRNQTLDQIVRRAAIHLRNGHHEAQIDLKPDLLGHIRMQVVSANHQVTVKIIAEHGFVKDMIESNIHQLKSDLQQQGLEVDKLEVTVSRDPEDSGNYKDKLAQSKARPDRDGRPNDDAPAKEKKRESAAPARPPDSEATVDYFA